MSAFEKIVQQDSLLQNSQIQLFIEPSYNRQTPILSSTIYPPEIIPLHHNRVLSLRKQQYIKNKMVRGKSLTSLCNKKTFEMNSKNEYYSQRGKLSSVKQMSRIEQKNRLATNYNIQKLSHLINIDEVLLSSRRSKPDSLGIVKQLSTKVLKASSKVQLERKIMQKKLIKIPFEPNFLQSEYLG